MSRSLDFLFDTTHTDERLLERLRGVCGLSFRPATDGRSYYYCRFLWREISLERNIFREIEEYPVEKLGWYLHIDRTDPDWVDIDVASWALLSYLVMHASAGSEGLLVFDLEVPLARYLFKGGELIDTLADNGVIQFPEHVARVGERWRAERKRRNIH